MTAGRILVVDDEEVARLSLLRILQLEGFEVTAVSDGETALRELSRSAYDLMILDLKMSGLSGIDVLAQAVDTIPDLKIVILTAYGSLDTAIQALRYRVNDYLIKPADPKEIIRSVRRSLSGDVTPGTSREIHELRSGYEGAVMQKLPFEQTIFHTANDIVIDCMRRQITWFNTQIHLTPTEARIIGVLLENNAVVVRHQELVHKVYGYRVGGEEAAKILRPVISRLNTKLERVPGGENWIHSIRGAGYLLEVDISRGTGETPAVKT